ncbi:hypothetical protein BDZ97DRAFT_1918814 [Flammula alnicola]|nr:hypothetical protein BDZ97DRAFT_1918814 [Flammula alnicola]
MGLLSKAGNASVGASAVASTPLQSTSSTSSGSRSAAKRQKASTTKSSTLFKIDLSKLNFDGGVFWNRKLVASGADLNSGNITIDLQIAREIVWNLFENNFRIELLYLDRCIFPRIHMSMKEGEERDEMVYDCFHLGKPVSLDFDRSEQHEGLGAADYEARMEQVDNFRLLLSSWSGPLAEKLRRMSALTFSEGWDIESTLETVQAVERIAYLFYCQTFFAYFGRAPSLPHVRPG